MYLDMLVGIIILFTIYKGYSSGFFVSFLSLFGVVVSLVITRDFTPQIMSLLRIEGGKGTFSMIYIVIFLVVYLLIGILLAFLESFIKVKKRTLLGIILGSSVGLIKGLTLSFVVLLFYNLLGDHIGGVKKYGEESRSNIVFQKAIPYARDILPKKIGDNIESKGYKKDIEKYIKDVLKEQGE